MGIPILSEIERLINEHGSSVILKEHIGLLNTKLQMLKEHLETLEKENATLKNRCRDLEQQRAHQRATAEFVEEAGALFMRKPEGGYKETPHCPACHSAMYSLGKVLPYTCGNKSCGQMASFDGNRLRDVMNRLP